jgi:two-component system LytT family sensor kinase
LWVAVFRSYSVSLTKTMTIEFCYLLFITADYYSIGNFIVPRFLLKKKYILFISTIILLITLSALFRALVAVQMNLHFFHAAPVNDFTSLYLNSLINISLWILLITIGKMLVDRIKSQQQLELLEKEKTKNELDFLKAQINPHALFNSLNTIYGHIDKSNQAARNILLQFSELLRYQLYDCSAEKVSLEKEIDYIKNYVAFQRLRKNENLIVNLEIENINPGLCVAPLLLVVLIENAFKFVGASSEKENKIVIRLFTKEAVLSGCVFNTTEPQTSMSNGKGIGITNLKRRLELLYPDKYTFENKNEKDFYETNLNLDLA